MGAVRTINQEQFDAEVAGGSVPAALDFTASWCGPCQALAPKIEEFAEKYDGRVLVAKVDIDQSPELATKFNVMSVPTILFFKNGEKVDQVSGNFPAKIEEKIEGLL